MNDSVLFVDKYAPKCVDDMLFDEQTKKVFSDMVKCGNLPSMTLIGCQGSGKTSIAKVISSEFNATTLFIPCATDGTIDVVRTRIRSFCESCSMDGRIKLVILDEIDSASSSGDSNFQKSLRTLIEEFQDTTRFILTANYPKILEPILSRCPIIEVGYDKRALAMRIKHILDEEKISYTRGSFSDFLTKTMKFFPDIRRIINYLQSYVGSGSLVVSETVGNQGSFVDELVEKCASEKDVLEIRQFYLSNKSRIEDYLAFSSEVFNKVVNEGLVRDSKCVLRLSDMIYQMNLVIDKEVCFFAFIVFLSSCVSKA